MTGFDHLYVPVSARAGMCVPMPCDHETGQWALPVRCYDIRHRRSRLPDGKHDRSPFRFFRQEWRQNATGRYRVDCAIEQRAKKTLVILFAVRHATLKLREAVQVTCTGSGRHLYEPAVRASLQRLVALARGAGSYRLLF
jgi:hypothetical protein